MLKKKSVPKKKVVRPVKDIVTESKSISEPDREPEEDEDEDDDMLPAPTKKDKEAELTDERNSAVESINESKDP